MDTVKFGRFLKEKREKNRHNLISLGVAIGVSENALRNWERGTSLPRLDDFIKLRDELGFKYEEMIQCLNS